MEKENGSRSLYFLFYRQVRLSEIHRPVSSRPNAGTIFKDSLIYDTFFSGNSVIHFWPEIGAKDALMWMMKTDDGCPIDQPGKFGYWDDALKEATPEQISWSIPTPPTCEDIILGGTARQVFQFKASDWLRGVDSL